MIEIGVFAFGFGKGFMSKKIEAYSDIAKNLKMLLKERKKIQKLRIKSDAHVTKLFGEEITHSYLKNSSVIMTRFLYSLSKLVKHFIF